MSLLMWCAGPVVTASPPSDHDTIALGEASLTQRIATTILPAESTVVLTTGRNATGLPGEDTVPVWSKTRSFGREIVEYPKLTRSDIALILLSWMVSHTCDSFPVEAVCGVDS